MRKMISMTRGAALVLGGAVLTVSGQAAAAVACPTGSNVVYVSGSSAFKSILQATQLALGSSVTIIYQSPGSCEGLGYLLGYGGAAALPDPDSTVQMLPTSPSGSNQACTVAGTPAQTTVDIGISDVYPSTCLGYAPTLNMAGSTTMTKDYFGPVQAMVLAVPSASTASSISAEAAYMVFKFGAATAANSIAPWTIPGDIFTRYFDSGVLNMTGAALGNTTKSLTAGNWANAQCNPNTSSCPNTATSNATMGSKITTAAALSAADTNAAIGDLAAQSVVSGLKALAFQGVGQSCGYYPDSTPGNHDFLNVRQGRYAIWGPEHLVVNVNSSGNPVGLNSNTAAVNTVIAALISTSTVPLAASTDGGAGLTDTQVGSIIDIIAAPAAGAIPQCAMQVQRTSEDGAEASYSPPAPCTCRFLSAATGTATGCTACTAANASTMCTGSTPVCRFGYCEAQ